MLLRRRNINVIEIQNNVSRVLKQRLVRARRKLPTEAYDRELELRLFVPVSDIRYTGLRSPLLYTSESCLQRYVVWILFLVYVFEYRDFHFPLLSLGGLSSP